jgi:hypothetical protein
VDRLVISFVILVTILFVGMAIMISPTKIAVLLSREYNSALLGTFMAFASILFVTGLVGIAVLGFIISKDQTTNKVNK